MGPLIPGRGNMDSFFKYGAQRVSTPVDLNSEMPPVQNFAFGGIANPGQRAFLRASDKAYLDARQAELDAFEKQRVAYNEALNKWQTEVYNPYKSQVDAYNAAAQKYNTDVYQPYQQQYSAYEKALADWNAGPRTSDYAGPAAPTLASQFTMTAPTAPKAFEMQAPVLPFKEEDVQKFQQEAASRAQKDAGSRALAIDVVSNPERFNFGSMSVSNRFMAEGGPVDKEDDDGVYEEGVGRLIKDFEGYGYTAEEIQDLVDKVAEAGRGGDELLAYLSPESMEFLKSRGGSGTINPITGLPEFKGGLLGKVGRAISRVFRGRGTQSDIARADNANRFAQPAPAPAPAAPAGPSAAELMKQLEASNAARTAAEAKFAADLRAQQEAAARAQQEAVAAALRADAEQRAKMVARPVIGTEQQAANVATPVMPTAAPTATAVAAARPLAPVSLGGTVGSRTTAPGMSSSPVPSMGAPRQEQGAGSPVVAPATPNFVDYSSRGVGTASQNLALPDMNAFGPVGTARQNLYGQQPAGRMFAPTPMSQAGGAFGTTYNPLAQYQGPSIPQAITYDSNLTPGMLGGAQNAGIMVDRMGNRIYSPGANPLFGFAKGGGVDVAALLSQNAETLSDEEREETINTNPVGTAQQYLQDLTNAGQERTTYEASPTRQSIKRTRVSPSGGAQGVKGMTLEYESLTKGEIGGKAPKARDTDSARAQLEELARQYQLKLNAARNKARGLSADTFGAPTLEGPSLTKASLAKKRFAKGGEAKKPEAEESEPSLFGVSSYATRAAERMFPGQMGQDDQRDAARHMLAAAMVARKTNPAVAEFLGKAHERTSNPESFFSMFGIGKPRSDYEMDVHNNRLGAELAARTKSQAELEKLVRAMALQSQNSQVEGKPWTMSREQMEARKDKGMTPPPEYAHGGAVHRAEGSPEEGEISDAEREVASRPAFVTPKSGKGRKEGPISKALKSGEAYTSMAKGVTELPYDIAGAPVDLATLLMRPLGYGVEKPTMGSDWIKSKMTGAGVRPEPPSDPTQRGFFTAGELLSNLTNPAGVTRAGVKGAEKAGKAATAVAKDFQEYNRQLTVPGASYAVRPTGSTMLSGTVDFDKRIGGVNEIIDRGVSNAASAAGQNREQGALIADFWEKKARNYFTRQFGTPDDPIADAIAKKRIKGVALEEVFPEYLIDQINVGKTRVSPEGQTRFFPRYPRAMDDFTQRYDLATGIKGAVLSKDPTLASPEYASLLSDKGSAMSSDVMAREADKLLMQGMRPEMINTNVGVATYSAKDPTRVIGEGTDAAKKLLGAYDEANAYRAMTPEQQVEWANTQFGNGRRLQGLDQSEVGPSILPENIRTAIERGEPIYDFSFMQKPLRTLFNPTYINEYLASIPTRELANIRFEDAVKGALKMNEAANQRAVLVDRIKAGKPVADSVFSKGVSAPLLQIKEGPLEGFAWKRIEDRAATVPEGAYVGHSVGGYEMGGATYTTDKREGFKTGQWQIYTLRDNRNRPVNTIEVKMLDEDTPVVTQIKGNGRATGNTAPEKYDTAVLEFLQKHLKPAAIEESDSYLTPLLKDYKDQLGPSPRMR